MSLKFSTGQLRSQIIMRDLPGLLAAMALTFATGYAVTAPMLGQG